MLSSFIISRYLSLTSTLILSNSFSVTCVFQSPSPVILPPQVFIKTWWRSVKPIISRLPEQPCLKSIGLQGKKVHHKEEKKRGGRRPVLLNIKHLSPGKGGNVVLMQRLTQLASGVHLPGSSCGSTLTFTHQDKPVLGQSRSSGVLSPLSRTLIMTWCIRACHTLEERHLSSMKYIGHHQFL